MKRYRHIVLSTLLVAAICGVSVAYAWTSPYLSLDNSLNKYVEIADTDQEGLDITDDMTIECWVYSKGIEDTKTNFVAAKDSSQPERSYGVGINYFGGTYNAAMYNSVDGTNGGTTGLILVPLPGFTLNQWHHIAWVYDASKGSYQAFLNGVSAGTANGLRASMYNSAAPFSIGGSSDAALGNSTWNGYLDNCRVWDKKRTTNQILSKMNGLVLPDAIGLVGQWTFKRNFSDTSENANHLVGVNGPVIQN